MAQQSPETAGERLQSFADVIASHTPEIQRVAQSLRTVIRSAIPDAQEGVYGGAKTRMALYSLEHEQDVVCGIQPAADHCKFYIHRVDPDDTSELRLEGKGKSTRHVKFHTAEDVDPAPIRKLMDLSVARRD